MKSSRISRQSATCVCAVACGVMLLLACGSKSKSVQQKNAEVPQFCADSAYTYVKAQVDLGPRVPATEAHAACCNYLVEKLTAFGAEVEVQQGDKQLFDGRAMQVRNIFAQFNKQASRRVLLCSHWDSRPYADNDPNPENHHTPILGANDGASGVGVLLEVARQLQLKMPHVGVDVLFFDLEDWGTPQFYTGEHSDDTWCLGSQLWAERAKQMNYKAQYGVLLDMVGAPGAQFYREQISEYFAKNVVDRVWNTAQKLGFASNFVNARGGAITDDHLYVNRIAEIPCVDIIQYSPYGNTGFAPYWHTLTDDMRNIDRNTLYVVGQTLVQLIYEE